MGSNRARWPANLLARFICDTTVGCSAKGGKDVVERHLPALENFDCFLYLFVVVRDFWLPFSAVEEVKAQTEAGCNDESLQ